MKTLRRRCAAAAAAVGPCGCLLRLTEWPTAVPPPKTKPLTHSPPNHRTYPPHQIGVELSKYGQVEDVRIFEVLSAGYDPAEAVRIFVQFDRVDAAVKANIDLQGRFFGGKEVRACWGVGVGLGWMGLGDGNCTAQAAAQPPQTRQPLASLSAPPYTPQQVRVAFFPDDRFERQDLAPTPGEFGS